MGVEKGISSVQTERRNSSELRDYSARAKFLVFVFSKQVFSRVYLFSGVKM